MDNPSASNSNSTGSSGNAMVICGLFGGVLGGVIGFLLRPSASMVGQLPFQAVVTRGSNLQGLDELLVPTAQTSFNYMLAGVIVGVVAGLVAGSSMRLQALNFRLGKSSVPPWVWMVSVCAIVSAVVGNPLPLIIGGVLAWVLTKKTS